MYTYWGSSPFRNYPKTINDFCGLVGFLQTQSEILSSHFKNLPLPWQHGVDNIEYIQICHILVQVGFFLGRREYVLTPNLHNRHPITLLSYRAFIHRIVLQSSWACSTRYARAHIFPMSKNGGNGDLQKINTTIILEKSPVSSAATRPTRDLKFIFS